MTNEDTRTKLCDFLTQALASKGEFLVDKIVLMHAPRGSNNRDYLRTWKRSNEVDRPMFDPQKSSIDKLTRAIVSLAENQLETIGSSQPSRFKITITQIDGTPTVYPFAVAPESDGEGDGDSENDGHGDGADRGELAPTRDALVTETLRQNRELHQRNSDTNDKVFNWMAKSVVQLMEQNDRLLAAQAKHQLEREQWLQKVEEAAGKKHEREMEAGIVAARIERDNSVIKEAMGLLPVLTSRLLEAGKDGAVNGDGGDKKMSELTVTLGEWGSSLTAEQQGKIAGALSPQQQIMLFELKNLVGKGGGQMLAKIAHNLFSSLHKRQVEIIDKTLTEAQAEKLVHAMKLAEEEATAAEPEKETKAKPEASQSASM
jgi:hypothetical protein